MHIPEEGVLIAPLELNGESMYKFMEELHIARQTCGNKPITLYVSGNGGLCSAGFGITDLIEEDGNFVGILLGQVSSMHATIWAVCQRRYVYPRASFKVHSTNVHGEGYLCQLTLEGMMAEVERNNLMNAKLFSRNSTQDWKWWIQQMKECGDYYKIFDAVELIKMNMARPVAEYSVELCGEEKIRRDSGSDTPC